MNTRNLVLLSLLVGIGTVLHAMVPPILFGMKPDMLLSMMFLGILLIPKVKYVVLLSILTGIVSALTTGVPGGQIANVIDKPITALIFLGLLLLMDKKIQRTINAPILTAIGTMISGSVFLMVALFILGLMEGGFLTLFIAIVLPATVVNTIAMVIIYPITQGIMKRAQPLTHS
ncbi:tryptophan transporter [Virgibacillus sp. MSJ-26]|uniref:tryptophan transporter n=1 Tax=Virgibacillus sp. MSJ-26 TaxID=2841522 RepID=UPI001C12032C|nr:tryptophan transporter [Virgibacillus sp. MSJ-26]MBU5468352.1 tryptophan transporter [Virgibacillus sp. MSJ-26]